MTSQKSSQLAQVAVRGASWTYVAYYSGKFIVFLSTIVLARLLTKGDFGVVGYALIVIGFLDAIKDLGINSAVIYYRDEYVADTAFWLSLAIGVGLFISVWFLAPLIGIFFNDPRAISVTRLLALNFPLSALGATHEALLIKELAFSRKFIPDFSRVMTKGLISIVLALLGFGPWSLIVGQLFGTVIWAAVLWQLVMWRPSFVFIRDTARSLLGFGLPIVGVNIVSAFAQDIDYLFIARYLGAVSLGVYTLAFRIPELILLQFCSMVAQVIFPVFAKIRDDKEALTQGFLETARYVAVFTVPIGLGMALLAEPFILTFFGQKWLEAVPVMRAISIYGLLISLGFNAGDVYKAQGKPGMLTRISIIHTCILAPALYWAVTVQKSIIVVGWVQASVALIVSIIYLTVALRMLNVSLVRLLNALKTPMAPAFVMVVMVLVAMYFSAEWATWLQLVLGIAVGGSVYLLVLYWLERNVVLQALQLLGAILTKRR